MAAKRDHSPELVPNPFIKKRNLEWSIQLEGSTQDDGDAISNKGTDEDNYQPQHQPAAAAVEAGDAKVEDHLEYFSGILTKASLSQSPAGTPQLPVADYRKLYEANFGTSHGAHFVIHQHDHPIAGTHYDLRLQINETSSASWAIMYGLPGDPNSKRLNRNATETRIHCLWNHLIETGSSSTGSLLIWDTGTYTVLHRRSKHAPAEDPDSQPLSDDSAPELSEQEKLHRAFQNRKIRLQLHGARLPPQYVLNLRLTKTEDAAGRAKGGRKPKTRRRRGGGAARAKVPEPVTTSDSDSELVASKTGEDGDGDQDVVAAPVETDQEGLSAMEREIRELEDEEVRRTNAYTGATNTIGSVHQRKWYLSLERESCGFVKSKKRGRVVWERKKGEEHVEEEELKLDRGGRLKFPFYVRGPQVERSVVTGRTGPEILQDEGVVGFVARKGWQAVLN